MVNLSEEKRNEIINALKERGAKLPCPRCGHEYFSILDGYFNQTIQTDLEGVAIGGPVIPSVIVICSRCGYLSQHALGVLGLLPREEAKK